MHCRIYSTTSLSTSLLPASPFSPPHPTPPPKIDRATFPMGIPHGGSPMGDSLGESLVDFRGGGWPCRVMSCSRCRRCIPYGVYHTVYTIRCIPYKKYNTVYTFRCIPYGVYHTVYTIRCAPLQMVVCRVIRRTKF